jgi:hypothetical protein
LTGFGGIVGVLIGVAFLIFGRRFAQINLRPFVSKQQVAERGKPEHHRLRMVSRGFGPRISLSVSSLFEWGRYGNDRL